MPIYEYKCNKCEKTFEQIVFPSDDEDRFECPSCGAKDICRLVSAFSCGLSGDKGSIGCAPSGGFS